ncbi:MAG: peptidoglycan editing factor PgeF [Vampirovibrionales bacterium]|nr:peptidoglycan editing factor PgeF [Vampirovibrionales bacterium]
MPIPTTPNPACSSGLPEFYQSPRLSTCAKQLIHGFSGKPLSLGGPALSANQRQLQRQALCQAIGVPFEGLATADQIHSATSKVHTQSDLSACDAIILSEPGKAALILVADCVPVILYDPIAHKGAVIHAGWRGTAQGITPKTATRLVEEFACSYENMIAAIGPSIGGCCYEVTPDVTEALANTLAPGAPSDWKTAVSNGCEKSPEQKSIVDLKRVNEQQLLALGVMQIDVLSHCTRCQPDRFFSFRRKDDGRQGVILMLK